MIKKHHEGIPELDLLPCLCLVGGDYLLASPCRDGPDNRVVLVIRIRIHEDVLQFLFWEKFGHRFGEHGFAGTGTADHHDMPPLRRSLPDDLDCMLLPDDLVDEFFGGTSICG